MQLGLSSPRLRTENPGSSPSRNKSLWRRSIQKRSVWKRPTCLCRHVSKLRTEWCVLAISAGADEGTRLGKIAAVLEASQPIPSERRELYAQPVSNIHFSQPAG